jgi:predicted nucleic acid-binding protein
VSWLSDTDEDRVFISVVTLAELRCGIERLPESARRRRLDEWLQEELPQRFEGRVLPVDGAIAHSWGRVMARGRAMGRPVGAIDAFIAATAQARHLTLVTRNVGDFEAMLNDIVNPWGRE